MIELSEKLAAEVERIDCMCREENILLERLKDATPHKAAIYRCLLKSIAANRERLMVNIGPLERLC